MQTLIKFLATCAVFALAGCATENDKSGSSTPSSEPTVTVTETITTSPEPNQNASPKESEAPRDNAQPNPHSQLLGEWKQTNSNSATDFMSAEIDDVEISVDWEFESGDSSATYWVGTPPTTSEITNAFTWTSTRNKAETDNALMASTIDSKDFTFKDGELSFEVSVQGMTNTVRMSKTNDDD